MATWFKTLWDFLKDLGTLCESVRIKEENPQCLKPRCLLSLPLTIPHRNGSVERLAAKKLIGERSGSATS